MTRIAFLVLTLDDIGGTARAVVNLANGLVDRHDVRIVSIRRTADRPHAWVDPRISVDHLIDARDPEAIRLRDVPGLAPAEAARLDESPSMVVPPAWEWQLSALTDRALRPALAACSDDVVVTVIPGLLVAAAQLLPPRVAVVHQEHRTSFDRAGGKDALLAFAPRADAVTMLGEPAVTWLQAELGSTCPETLVVPNMVPPAYRPRSRLAGGEHGGLVLAAGRFAPEKQFAHLVRAFGLVADELPGWRVRIFGQGPQRGELVATTHELGLEDRVELPGTTRDMGSEWAKADLAVCCSFREGLPLVVQEAMAAGVPVAAYDCPLGVRDIVEDGTNGLLVAQDAVPSLGAAILRLAHDRALRRRLGAAALETAARYDAATITRTWEELLDRVVARRRAGEPHPPPPADLLRAEPPPPPEAAAELAGGLTPVLARATLLADLLAVANDAGADAFVLPRPAPEPLVLVVPLRQRRAFLATLAERGLPPWACATDPPDHRWNQRRGTAAQVVAAVLHGMTTRLVVEPWPTAAGGPRGLLDEGCRVEVQFWTEDADGRLLASRPNPWADRVPPGTPTVRASVEGVTAPVLELATRPAPGDRRFPVDVVYAPPAAGTPPFEELLGLSLLRHSLRSVTLFAPWVRRIHVLATGPRPAWLREHPRVRWVEHPAVGTGPADPAAVLLAAPDVAEHVVVMREEVLLGRSVPVDRFFDAGGRPAVVLDPAPLGPDAADERRRIEESLGVTLLRRPARGPQPMRWSLLADLAADDRAAGADALALAGSWACATGQAAESDLDVREVHLARGDLGRTLRRTLAERDVDAVSLAADALPARPATARRHLETFLAGWTPVAAPWEAGP